MKKPPEQTPLKQKMVKPMYSMVDPVDRIPMIAYDEEKLIQTFMDEKTHIDSYRTDWYERKFDYLRQWDDYLDYPSEKILEGQKNVHIPVTHEKLQAWHARMYKSIFAVDPIFYMEALNLTTRDEVEATKQTLAWYLRSEINYNQGMKPFFDELLWDLGTDGWAVAYKRWEIIERKMLALQTIDRDAAKEQMLQALGELKTKGKIDKYYKEVEQIARIFSGVVVETVPHECVYFPDYIPTSGNLNHPKLVMIERLYSKDQLLTYAEQGFFDKEAVTEILLHGKGGLDARKQELQRERERFSGVRESDYRAKDQYSMFTAFYRDDLAGDGIPQEYIFTASLKAKKIARGTYLDRVCPDGNRPVYKFDLLKRPRSSYSRGLVELLYPLNTEIDEFHNMRRAAGRIANMPWGFYKASTGLEKEILEVKPGRFFPVDDPVADVRPMIFGNVTSWALQEEGLAQSYADRLTSMPPMMQGQVPSAVGPLRSTSGVMALMNEAQTPLDVYLDRMRIPMGQLFGGILSDIQLRFPESFNLLILGEQGNMLYGEDGKALYTNIAKPKIMGKYKFLLAANDAQYNPERDRQNAMSLLQLGLSQFPVQMGLTTPANAYNLLKAVYQKNGVKDLDAVLTAPKDVLHPLNLYQEFITCVRGAMPVIVLNDNHDSKITGLTLLAQSPQYMEMKTNGSATQLSDALLNQAIELHTQYRDMLAKMQQFQNQTGSEQPVTAGARSTGAVNAQGEPAQGGQSERERANASGAGQTGGVASGGESGGPAQG